MTTEEHRAAREAFRELLSMSEEEQDAALKDRSHRSHSVPTSALLTAYVLRELGFPVDDWDILWTKLYRRSVASVFALYRKAKKEEPEKRLLLVSEFGRKVGAR